MNATNKNRIANQIECRWNCFPKRIYLIGEAAGKIKKDLREAVFIESGNIENAVKHAFKTAGSKDIVLLSPACASFDQFAGFEERGKLFKELVNKL